MSWSGNWQGGSPGLAALKRGGRTAIPPGWPPRAPVTVWWINMNPLRTAGGATEPRHRMDAIGFFSAGPTPTEK